MDQAYLTTPGHFLGLTYRTAEPSRVGVLIESALTRSSPGSNPSTTSIAYTLWHGKLWSVHLNDQNGLKYDQDKVFGSVDLRRAFTRSGCWSGPAMTAASGRCQADAHDQARRPDEAPGQTAARCPSASSRLWRGTSMPPKWKRSCRA